LGLDPKADGKNEDSNNNGGIDNKEDNVGEIGMIINYDPIVLTFKKPSWISRTIKTASKLWSSFSSWISNSWLARGLRKGDNLVTFKNDGDDPLEGLKGNSPAEPLGNSPMKPLGNSKQEILAVIFQTMDGAAINTSDPSVQKAANDAILSYQDADILELSAISALRKSLNQNSNTRKEFIKRHKHNEAILKGKKFYRGKFLGDKLKKALDYENALIDAYNKANGMKLTNFQESNMETILGLNHSASSDVYGTSEPVDVRYSNRYVDKWGVTKIDLIIEIMVLSKMQIAYLDSINKPSSSHRYEPLTKEEYEKLIEIK
jgi:hypothetical protein